MLQVLQGLGRQCKCCNAFRYVANTTELKKTTKKHGAKIAEPANVVVLLNAANIAETLKKLQVLQNFQNVANVSGPSKVSNSAETL